MTGREDRVGDTDSHVERRSSPARPDGGAGTFERIDWDEIDREGEGVGAQPSIGAIGIACWLVAVAADRFVVPSGEPTVAIGEFVWDVSAVDWLFLLTLLAIGVGAVVPLCRDRRLALHYWRRFRRNRMAVASAGFLLATFAVGVVGPVLLARPELNFAAATRPPVFLGGTWAHPFGTDAQGRDLGVLIVYGMRISLEVGLISTLFAVTIGTIVGAIAAFSGGLTDELLMRYVDLQQSFPTFLLLVLLVYLFGGSLLLIIGLYALFSWEGIARLVRSEAFQRIEATYVDAARAAGASRWWIVRKHVVPNVSNTVITAATLQIPVFILGEAALSFLGLGDPNAFSWGRTISDGRGDLATAPWISTIPGLFLFLTVLAINFVGDALRDAIDPRSTA